MMSDPQTIQQCSFFLILILVLRTAAEEISNIDGKVAGQNFDEDEIGNIFADIGKDNKNENPAEKADKFDNLGKTYLSAEEYRNIAKRFLPEKVEDDKNTSGLDPYETLSNILKTGDGATNMVKILTEGKPGQGYTNLVNLLKMNNEFGRLVKKLRLGEGYTDKIKGYNNPYDNIGESEKKTVFNVDEELEKLEKEEYKIQNYSEVEDDKRKAANVASDTDH